MPEHGGRLLRSASEFGVAVERWLDLSTGISPFAWPVPAIPPHAWRRLPEDEDNLVDVACNYYGARNLLPVAGSQAAIQALPELRHKGRIGIIAPGYAEHAHAWQRAGHRVDVRPAAELLVHPDAYDVIVLIHPGNPGGECFETSALLELHRELSARGGWLIVDEAFMDATPKQSLCPYADRKGLVVLRSAGKFFGLAGARAGFVCARPALLERLGRLLGPWTVTGPTRWVLQRALADIAWQKATRQRLQLASTRLAKLLLSHGLEVTAGTAFFQWCRDERSNRLQRAIAKRAILVRLFETPPSLRFGLPGAEVDWKRLDTALAELLA